MKNKILFSLSIIFLLVLSSCEKFLEENPKGIITVAGFYKTTEDATIAETSLYGALSYDLYRGQMLDLDLRSDDMTIASTAWAPRIPMENYTYNGTTIDLGRWIWPNSYIGIERANVVIEKVEPMNIPQTIKDRVVGTAYFIRALHYYELARVHGDCPLKLKATAGTEGNSLPRSPVADVFKSVIADLIIAADKLPVQSANGRASKGAALGLLAKTLLYTKEYDKAKAAGLAVEKLDRYSLYTNYADAFDCANKETNHESLFEAVYHQDVDPGNFFMKDAMPANCIVEGRYRQDGAGWGSYAATLQSYDSYETGDLRKDYNYLVSYHDQRGFDSTFNIRSIGYVYLAKYRPQLGAPWGGAANNFPVMRYAEVLLMIAEAENELNGPSADAQIYMNYVRTRAGLANIGGAAIASKDAFRNAIIEERRHELLFEGQRFFDLVRFGKLNEALTAIGKPALDVAKFMYMPIHQENIDKDPALNNLYSW